MSKTFMLASLEHLHDIVKLYDAIHEDLQKTINYPRWPKGIYPDKDSAKEAILKKEMYILQDHNCIVASVVLNHQQDLGYEKAAWLLEALPHQVMVIHTLAVDPQYKGLGYASYMIEEIKKIAIQKNCIALRLDITQENLPARYLYQKHGFYFTGITDLHRQEAGIDYCEMYEYNLLKPRDQLTYIEKIIEDFVSERDWHQYHTADNLTKSIMIEAAELLECFQWDDEYDLEHVCEELADVFIYCFQLSAYLKIDIQNIIISKMKKNREKYPTI